MAFHVTGRDGVYMETRCPNKAKSLLASIADVTIREGSVAGLRERSKAMFGHKWCKGPSDITITG